MREIALGNEILRGVVGSTAHGAGIDGEEDRDEMGIFIEPPERVCGWRSIDHYIYRDKPEGARSEPGDLDLTFYSLRKFCYLAARGNPSVLVLLWLPSYVTKTEPGEKLLAMRTAFVSRESGERFLGYLVAQKKTLKGESTKKVSRPELVEKYGFDTKFAMHALRLGFQGIEYLSTGRLTIPIGEPNLGILRAVRSGGVTFSDTLNLIEDAEIKLRELVSKCCLTADLAAVEAFMVSAHRRHWLWPAE
jgi:uncharacterized protein